MFMLRISSPDVAYVVLVELTRVTPGMVPVLSMFGNPQAASRCRQSTPLGEGAGVVVAVGLGVGGGVVGAGVVGTTVGLGVAVGDGLGLGSVGVVSPVSVQLNVNVPLAPGVGFVQLIPGAGARTSCWVVGVAQAPGPLRIRNVAMTLIMMRLAMRQPLILF
jgi:hypothetical protein